jgi:AcrR family transcriptional regulator
MSEATAAAVPRAHRASRQRGESTRRKLLDATLRVIARDGVRAVTHRAVAREAGLSVSLTTYYFVDLYDLIASAFLGFFQAGRGELEASWQVGFAFLDRYPPERLDNPLLRRRIRDHVARLIADYVLRKIVEQPTWLAVEHHFFFEALVDERLTALARQHRRRLVLPMLELCQRLGSEEPEIDADLLFGTLTRLEYESLVVPPSAVDEARIRREIRRLIGWIARVA